jgi:hypothetical protein
MPTEGRGHFSKRRCSINTSLSWSVPGAAVKAANLGGESPPPSVARFGRLVYPMRGEVTNRDMLGGKRHSCPVHKRHCGGNDLGGSKPGGLKINE